MISPYMSHAVHIWTSKWEGGAGFLPYLYHGGPEDSYGMILDVYIKPSLHCAPLVCSTLSSVRQ